MGTDRVRLFVPGFRLPEPGSQDLQGLPVKLEANYARLPGIIDKYLDRADMQFNMSSNGAVEASAQVVPRTPILLALGEGGQVKGLEATISRLQFLLYEKFKTSEEGYGEFLISKGHTTYARLDIDTYVEIGGMGGDDPHPLAIGLRTFNVAEAPKDLLAELVAMDIPNGKSSAEDIFRLWGLTIESLLPDSDTTAAFSHDLVLAKKDTSIHHVFTNKIKTLMERGILSKRQSPGTALVPVLGATALTAEAPTPELPHAPEYIPTATVESLRQSLDVIAGSADIKEKLIAMGAMLIDPERAKQFNVKASHFYLHGAPGTGKSTLLEAFSHGVGAQLYPLVGNDISDSHYGQAAQNIARHMGSAKALLSEGNGRPVIIVIEELDTLVARRHDPYGYHASIIKAFNTHLDDLQQFYPNKIIVVGTTNAQPSELDESIARAGRLEPIAVFAPRSASERREIWRACLVRSIGEKNDIDDFEVYASLYASDVDPSHLAGLTEGMTGADFTKILENIRRAQYLTYIEGIESRPIARADIEAEIIKYRKQ